MVVEIRRPGGVRRCPAEGFMMHLKGKSSFPKSVLGRTVTVGNAILSMSTLSCQGSCLGVSRGSIARLSTASLLLTRS